MSKSLAPSWGIKWDGVQSMQMDDPGVGRFRFVITKCNRDVNKKGKPYVNVGCKVVHVINGDQKDKGKTKFEYLSLEAERLGFTKTFFENIGAGHVLVPTKGPEAAVGIMFEGDIVINKSADGREFKNMRNLKPFAHQTEEDASEPEEVEAFDEEAEAFDEEDSADEDTATYDHEDEDEDDVTREDIENMKLTELKEFVEDNDLDVDLKTIKGLKPKRRAVIAEIFGDDDEEDEEEEAKQPPKRTKAAPAKGVVGGRR